jgi:O-antigen ligase
MNCWVTCTEYYLKALNCPKSIFLMFTSSFIKKKIFGQPFLEFFSKSAIYIILTGLFTVNFFRILPNIGIIILLVCSLIYASNNKQSFKNILTNKDFYPFILLYFVLLLSSLLTNQENYKYAIAQLILKIQYPAFALSFAFLPSFSKKTYYNFFFFFFIIVIITSFISTYCYFANKEAILKAYASSGIIFTIIDHVRYSLFVSLAIFLGIYLVIKNYSEKNKFKFFLLISGLIFLVLFLHLLAVRIGLVAFYLSIVLASIYFFFKKKILVSGGMICLILIFSFLSYKYIETIRIRYDYTIYDLEQSSKTESGNNYSISRRFFSNKVAYAVFLEHPFIGIGEGNIKSGIEKKYKEEHPYILPENILMPHNQYLRTMASMGIIGLLIFIYFFYVPLFNNKNYLHLPLLMIYFLVSLSFISEDTLDIQLGLTFSLFFIMINLHYLKGHRTNNPNAEI